MLFKLLHTKQLNTALKTATSSRSRSIFSSNSWWEMCSSGNRTRSVRPGGKQRSIQHTKISEIQTGIFGQMERAHILRSFPIPEATAHQQYVITITQSQQSRNNDTTIPDQDLHTSLICNNQAKKRQLKAFLLVYFSLEQHYSILLYLPGIYPYFLRVIFYTPLPTQVFFLFMRRFSSIYIIKPHVIVPPIYIHF